jgi:hypothetical protein
VQAELPVAAEYLPKAQLLHVAEAKALNVPASQSEQEDKTDEPIVSTNFPAGQSVQPADEVNSMYLPTGQFTQIWAVVDAANMPGIHAKHASWPVSV